MKSHSTTEAPWWCLDVSMSVVFCHWDLIGSYLNTSDMGIKLPMPPEYTEHIIIDYITLWNLCQVTCNNKVTTNADTSQATSVGGEVSSWGPCRGASGPGLRGGEGVSFMIIIIVSSTYDVHLNSVCYNTVVWYDELCVLPNLWLRKQLNKQ